MATLPVGQLFRYDFPLGSYEREAGFVFHVSIASLCVSGIEDSPSVRWRLNAGAACVCSFYALHVGINIDLRVSFWRSLAASVQRVSQRLSRWSLFLAGGSNIWFPAFHLGRSRQANVTLIPIVKGIMDANSLDLQNPLDQPTHRSGAALDIFLTTSLLVCHDTSGFQLLSRRAPLFPPRVRSHVVFLPVEHLALVL